VLPTSDIDFVPDISQIESVLEADERSERSIAMIILNSPSNPSGAVYTRDFIEKLSHIIKKYPHLGIKRNFFPVFTRQLSSLMKCIAQ
jgi:aspartate/methionine/tyrosine aminotransferase